MTDICSEASWKKTISGNLNEKNKRNNELFAEIIKSHSRLIEYSESLKTVNQRLTLEVERLKCDGDENKQKGDTGSSSGDGNNEKIKALEQKLYKAQEELMELHKKKGENAQQIIDLNNTVKERDKQLVLRDSKIQELESKVVDVTSKCEDMEQVVNEVTMANQCLTDELQALQMAYSSLEGSLRRLQEDNQDLVSRWMALKARDADRVNEENAQFQRDKQEKVREDLRKAANEDVVPRVSRLSSGDVPLIGYVNAVPTRALQIMEAHEGEVNAVRWGPSGQFFATGGTDRKLKFWEVQGGKCEQKCVLIGSNAGVTSVDIDFDEKLVLGACNDFASRIWTVNDQRLRHTLTGHSGKVLAAKFLNDPDRVVSGSYDRTLKLWDVRTKACTKTMFPGSSCNDLVVVDGTNIVSAHFDKKLRFFDVRSDSNALKEITLDNKVTSLDITWDKNYLLGCTRENNIAIISLKSSTVVTTLSAEGFHVAVDWTRASFSPDGSYVAAGSSDGGVYIWELSTSTLHSVLREHHDAVIACAWNPNGRSLLSCDKQKKVIYWSDM